MGLTRIATQGLPVAIAIGLICIGFVMKELHFLAKSFFLIIVSLFSIEEVSELFLPVKSNEYNKMIHKSCNYVNQHKKEIGTIYYFHPLIAYFNNITTKENYKQYCHSFTQLEDDTKNRFKPGDIIIRDSKFGAIEQGMPFDKLQQYPWILPVKHFYVKDGAIELNGEQQSIIVYQVFDTADVAFIKQKIKKATKTIKLDPSKQHFKINTSKEFFDLTSRFSVPSEKANSYSIQIAFTNLSQNNDCSLVFDDGKGNYNSYLIKGKKGQISMHFYRSGLKGKLYIYNPSKSPVKLDLSFQEWLLESDIDIHSTEK
jgi:hypothetical protein